MRKAPGIVGWDQDGIQIRGIVVGTHQDETGRWVYEIKKISPPRLLDEPHAFLYLNEFEVIWNEGSES